MTDVHARLQVIGQPAGAGEGAVATDAVATSGDAAAARPRSVTTVRRSLEEDRSFTGDVAQIVRDLWEYRDLVHQLTLRDIRIRYTQAIMGMGWALLAPMLIVLSGLLVRFAIAQASGRSLQLVEIGATALKGLPWSFFSAALNLATASLISNKTLITKLYFPREAIPLATVLAQTKDLFVGFAVLAVILPFFGVTLSLNLLWAPVLVLLLLVFTLASAVFLSCANLFFRDVKYIVQLLLTFGIFLTPIFFEPQMFGPVGSKLLMLNPLSPIIEGLRLAVIDGQNLLAPIAYTSRRAGTFLVWTPWYLLYATVWAVGGLLLSLRLFRRASFVFAEYT